MNQLEVVQLLRYVKAKFPQQQIDEYTAEAWTPDMAEYRIQDAKLAVDRWSRSGHSFISVGELASEIRSIRNERIARWPEPPPPDPIADSPKLAIEFSKEWRRRAGDGEFEELSDEQYQRMVMGRAVHQLAAAQSRKSITGVIEETQQRMREAVERKATAKRMVLQQIKDAGDELVRKFEDEYYGDDVNCPDCGDRYARADVYSNAVPPNHPNWEEVTQRICPNGHVWVVRKVNEID